MIRSKLQGFSIMTYEDLFTALPKGYSALLYEACLRCVGGCMAMRLVCVLFMSSIGGIY